jgi:hypothetical protein
MKSIQLPLVMCASLLLGACSTASFNKTGNYTAESTGVNCKFDIYTTNPDTPYKEIGLIEYSGNFMNGKLGGPESIRELKEMSGKSVCANGGNGMLVWETNGIGVYKKATVIKIL